MPIPDIYGPLISRGDVENAVLSTLKLWMIAYVAAVERYQDLPARVITTPASASSYVGDLDYEAWEASSGPTIVVVAQPVDPPIRQELGVYNQFYLIDVAAVVSVAGDAVATRLLADQYGAALAALLTQQGGLGGFAQSSMLEGAPRTEYIDPDVRDAVRAVVTVRSYVCDITDESQGPRVPPADPYAREGALPLIEQVTVNVEAESLTD